MLRAITVTSDSSFTPSFTSIHSCELGRYTQVRNENMKMEFKIALLNIILIAATATLLSGCGSLGMSSPPPAQARETGLSSEARGALTALTARVPAAGSLMSSAKGILVFPEVTKGGFLVGAFHGEGAMFKQGRVSGYYDTGGASYGFQAGIQQYGYALFFMSESALKYVDNADGWEIGMGPSIVIVDEGMGKSLTTITANKDIYGFVFDQRGLMAGMGLQGSKITRIDR